MAILLSGEEVVMDEVMTMTLAMYTSMSMVVVVVDHHHHLTNVNELGKGKLCGDKLCVQAGAPGNYSSGSSSNHRGWLACLWHLGRK